MRLILRRPALWNSSHTSPAIRMIVAGETFNASAACAIVKGFSGSVRTGFPVRT
jgi:hypothetical protein